MELRSILELTLPDGMEVALKLSLLDVFFDGPSGSATFLRNRLEAAPCLAGLEQISTLDW